MDAIGRKLLIVTKENHFLSLVSIGDIQRAIIKNVALETPVAQILRDRIIVATELESLEEIKEKVFKYRMEFIPVFDSSDQLIQVYFWEDFYKENLPPAKQEINIPVVIMAGGKGTRLRPLTNVIPKPLIPISEKTIVEEIITRFYHYGCTRFKLSVNYKADLIKHYLKDFLKDKIEISYIHEEKPLGTAGSLYLLKDEIRETFFVSNCDILIEDDYQEIWSYHQKEQNELTIVAALKHYKIPYGTIETAEGGRLVSLQEKPEFSFKINSGLYVLEPHLLKEIPENQFFHITDLIHAVLERGGKIGVFPVTEKSWRDIGIWDEYLKVLNP